MIVTIKFIFFTSVFLLYFNSYGQDKSVGIGTRNPDKSAVLDLESVDQGFLMPRLDSGQVKTLLSPAQGLIIFNVQDECFWFKKNAGWKRMCSTDSLFNNYLIAKYLTADTAIINYLNVRYSKADTIIADYIRTIKIVADSAVINNLKTDSLLSGYINSTKITADSVLSKYISVTVLNADTGLFNYLSAKNLNLDTIYNNYLSSKTIRTDSMYLNGIPVQSLLSDSLNKYAWLQKGNAGTSERDNYIGTSDKQDLVFKTFAKENVRITAGGNVGIGTSTPASLLSVGRENSAFRVDTEGVVSLGNGTLTIPQLTFINDRTTGLYAPATKQMAFATGGNQTVFLDGINQNIYLGFLAVAGSITSTALASIVLGKGSVQGGYYNINAGYAVNGSENTCLGVNYNGAGQGALTINGSENGVFGAANNILSGGNSDYIFGAGNTITAGISNYVIGTQNNVSSGTIQDIILGNSVSVSSGYTNSIGIGQNITIQNNGNLVLSCNKAMPGPTLTTKSDNQLMAQFYGGYELYSGVGAGVALAAGGGSWSNLSDKNRKENFKEIEKDCVLTVFCGLKTVEWQYKAQRPDKNLNAYTVQPKHIGIMAQDFYQAFGYGEFENRITQTDIDGVMTVAIQALEERTKKITSLEKDITSCKKEIADLSEKLNELVKQTAIPK